MLNLEQYLSGQTYEPPPTVPLPPVPMGAYEYQVFVYKTLRHVKPRNTVVYQPYSQQVV